ncbi:hypothetical protein [Mucilaginibacter sp. PAMB04168]
MATNGQLIILRDMIMDGQSTCGKFLNSAEKIATHILADRLGLLEIVVT